MATVRNGSSFTLELPAYHQLAVIAGAIASGAVYRLGDQPGQEPYGRMAVAASATLIVGPYASTTRFLVVAEVGDLTVGTATPVDFPAPSEAATAAQGAKADTAVQPGDLGTAAFTATTDYAPAGATTTVVVAGVGTLHFTNGALTSVT